jgi:archaellum component FlaF (FlaF/FlaG flagellin family)
MKSRAQNRSNEVLNRNTLIRRGRPRRAGVFAFLTTFAVILAAASLSSCSGYTTAASVSTSGGGTTGTPGAGVLSAGSTSVSFGNVAVGSTGTQTVTLTNTGTATVNISAAAITGAVFTVIGGSQSPSLAVGQAATYQLQFAPTLSGATTGNLTVTSDASNSPLSISLSGTGMQPTMAISPASLTFNNITMGQSSSQTITLTNNGNANLMVTAATISGTGFSMSGLTLSQPIASGQSTSFSVKFTPTSTTGASGNIVFTDNAPGSQQTLPITGSAVAANSTLTANPGSFNFNNVAVNSSSPETITLMNSGTASITINQITTTGPGFSATGLTVGQSIAAGATATFTAKFAPTATGLASGIITLTTTASNPSLSIPLSGTGTQGSLVANPSSVAFTSLQVGSSGSVPVTVTNQGTAAVSITGHSITGPGFTLTGWSAPASLTPGQTTSFTVTFAPTVSGAASGSVSITNNLPGSPFTIALTGTGLQAQISANPTSVAFTNVVVGNSNSQPITLHNGGNATLTFSQVSMTGAASGFSSSGVTTSTTIPAGGNATLNAIFTPVTSTSVTGSIVLSTNGAPASLTINLSGTGVAATRVLAANPTSLSFGTVNVNSSSQLTTVLTNNGNSSVTVSGVTVVGAGFSASGVSNGTILTPGQTATLTVTFAPTTGGAVSPASVSVASNATGSPTAITLTGTGQAAAAHSVSLNWNASSTAGVSEYNVFRATASGAYGPTPLNPSPVSTLAYTDTTVVAGQSYFYVVQAVDDGVSSANSNEVPVTIP